MTFYVTKSSFFFELIFHLSAKSILHLSSGNMVGDRPVPPVLLSGHHADIALWRREQSLLLTARRRPDLITAARASGALSAADEKFLAALKL